VKIACLGNMNNNFFALARHLRDRGFDADLLRFDDEPEHFSPANDTFDREYERYTVRLGWGRLRDVLISARAVRESLSRYDVLIGCGLAPAFAERIGRRLEGFIPYGADLYQLPTYTLRRHLKNAATYLQRRGIRRAGWIVLDNPEYDDFLLRLGVAGEHLRLTVPMIYTPLYNPTTIADVGRASAYHERFLRVREACDLLVFHHARHVWRTVSNPYARKGNDCLIRGFAAVARDHAALKTRLVLFEYGPDVVASKELIQDLGIRDHVVWMPKMARKDIMVGISMADVGVGELTISWVTGGVTFEFLAMAKPLIQYRAARDERQGLYPVLNASSAEDVARQLERVIRDPDGARALGAEGMRWHQAEAVERPLAAFEARIARGDQPARTSAALSSR